MKNVILTISKTIIDLSDFKENNKIKTKVGIYKIECKIYPKKIQKNLGNTMDDSLT